MMQDFQGNFSLAVLIKMVVWVKKGVTLGALVWGHRLNVENLKHFGGKHALEMKTIP